MTELVSLETSVASSVTLTLPILVLIMARALDGLTGGNISVANAYVADVSSEADRSRNFGRMGVAANLGMVLGPALAGILGATALGEALPVFVAAGVAFVGVVFHRGGPARNAPPGWPLPHRPQGRLPALRAGGSRLRSREPGRAA